MNMKRILTLSLLLGIGLCCFAQIKRPDTYAYTRGVEAYQKEDNREALDWFNREIKDHPDNGYAFIYISILRYENEELGKSLTAINNALKNLPKKDKEYISIAYATRAGIYLAMEDTISALHDYATAIKLQPSNQKFYNSRAQVYFEQEKYSLADADYQQMIRIDPGDVMGYMGIGRNEKEQGKYDAAIDHFSYVIKMAPDYTSGYSFRAECYIAQKKYSEAIDDIIEALTISGDRKASYLLYNMDKEALPLIKAKFQVQANKNLNEASWQYYLGRVYEKFDKYLDAINYYQQAQSIDANSIFLERIAICYYEMGNYETALDNINNAIYMDGDDYDLVMMKGDIYNELGNYPMAIAELDKYVAKYPDSFYAYYRRGWYKDEANDIEGAIDDYTMAITLKPQYAYAYCGRGKFYDMLGKKDLAHADFEKVIELDTVPNPGSSCAHYAYYYLGFKDKAIDFMNAIIAKNEDRSGSYYDAACLYSIMGDKTTALSYLRKAFECGYRRIAHTYADKDLDNIRNEEEYKALIEQYSNIDSEGEELNAEPKSEEDKYETVEIPFTKENGVTKVKCTINDLPLHFVFDTGAADVTISMVEANFMIKNDYIQSADIIGSARYMDANGDITEGTIVNIRKVNFGGLELDNVRASVVRNQKAPLLLGQSVLGRLGKIEIDNQGLKLVISHKIKE